LTKTAATATLLSPKQWAFVDAVIKGATYSKAYTKAGFKAANDVVAQSNSSKLIRNHKVATAIEASRRAASGRAGVTLDTIVERLEKCMDIALTVDPPQVSAAVAAVMGQAKVLGLVVDRSQIDITHHKPAPFPTKVLELSQAEWLAQFDQKKALPGPKKKST
jgi:hypothetical protein